MFVKPVTLIGSDAAPRRPDPSAAAALTTVAAVFLAVRDWSETPSGVASGAAAGAASKNASGATSGAPAPVATCLPEPFGEKGFVRAVDGSVDGGSTVRALECAREAGRPVFPVASIPAPGGGRKSIGTWARMTLELPFGMFTGVNDTGIGVPSDRDMW